MKWVGNTVHWHVRSRAFDATATGFLRMQYQEFAWSWMFDLRAAVREELTQP